MKLNLAHLPVFQKGIFITLLVVFINVNLLFATTKTSAITGDFSVGSTWVGGVVPVVTDTVVIANGDTVNFTSNPLILRYLIINSGGVLENLGQLNITESGSSGTLFTINGLYLAIGSTDFYPYSTTSSKNHINGHGTISGNGGNTYWNFFGGASSTAQFDTTSNLTFDLGSSGWLRTGPNTNVYFYGIANFISGDVEVGNLWTGTGKLTIGSTGQIIIAGNIKITGSGIIYNNGIVTVTGDILTGGTFSSWYNYAGSIVNIAGHFLMLDINHSANSRLYANYSGNTVNYNGTGNQKVIKSYSPAFTYWNLQCSNSGKKTLSANTIINGNLTIQNAAQLDDSANFIITLKGNWANTSSNADPFLEQAGTVTYSGTAAQAITASPVSGGESFYNLTVSNTSGDVSLNHSVTVNNTLNMTDGKIILGTNNLLLSTPTAITGYCDTNFVITDNTGYLQINGITTTPLVFPVGPSTSLYNPATINNDATPANYNVRVCDYVNTAGICSGGTPITDWGINKTWNIGLASGTANATVELEWNSVTDEMTGFQPTNCAVNHHNGSNWEAYTFGNYTDKGSGYRSKAESGLTSFSPFGVSGGGYPLPIELLSFTGELNTDGQVVLNWTTATESNNDYFTVEKGTPSVLRTSPPPPPTGGGGGETLGINFVPIGIVKGAGNSTANLFYHLLDESPLSLPFLPTGGGGRDSSPLPPAGGGQGVRYYRLQQTDFDGKSSYSPIISIHLQNSGTFTIYPNPATGTVNLNIPGEKEELINISVIDKLGRTILSKAENMKEGQNSFNMDVSGLSNGIYLLQTITTSGAKEQKQLAINN